MIISVDPSTAEDIATFAMVKQYTLQTIQVTLEITGWTADAEHGGYVKTKSQGITGSLVTFTDPSAIVSYNITDGDTSNFDIASLAGIKLDSIVAGQTSYDFTFRADELPTDNTVIDVLVYGSQIVGGGSGGDPTSAEEITAAALQALDDRVTALETEMPNKVDTSDVSTVETPNTIAKRDANGRIQAADPASGATDKTLVTANWVSQTGEGAPNNLLHRSGDEDYTGTKNNPTMGIGNVYIGGSTQRWIRIAYSTISDASIYGYVIPDKLVGIAMSCEFYLIGRTNNSIFNIRPTIYANPNPALFALTYDGTNYELWYYYNENNTNRRCTFCIRGANGGRPFTLDGITNKASLNPADYVYITTPTVI